MTVLWSLTGAAVELALFQDNDLICCVYHAGENVGQTN